MTLRLLQSTVKAILITTFYLMTGDPVAAVVLSAEDYYMDSDVHIIRLSEYDGETPWLCTFPGKSLFRKQIDFTGCSYNLEAPDEPSADITCNAIPSDWIRIIYWLPSFQYALEFKDFKRPPLAVLHLFFTTVQGYVGNIGFDAMFEPAIKPPAKSGFPRFFYTPEYKSEHIRAVVTLMCWILRNKIKNAKEIDAAIKRYCALISSSQTNPGFVKILRLLLGSSESGSIAPPYTALNEKPDLRHGLLTLLLRWYNEKCQLDNIEREEMSATQNTPDTLWRHSHMASIAWHLTMPLVRLYGSPFTLLPRIVRHGCRENHQIYHEFRQQAVYYLEDPSWEQLNDFINIVEEPVLLLYAGKKTLLSACLTQNIQSVALTNIPLEDAAEQIMSACFINANMGVIQRFIRRIPETYLQDPEAQPFLFRIPPSEQCTSLEYSLGRIVTGQRMGPRRQPSTAYFRTGTSSITEFDKYQQPDELIGRLPPLRPFHSPCPLTPAPTLTPSPTDPDGDRTPLASGSPTPVFLPKQITPEPQP